MDFPIHKAGIFHYIVQGVTVPNNYIPKSLKIVFTLANSADPNEMQPYAVFHLGFQRERSGSVVECLTRDRRAAGSSLTGVTA